MPFFLFKRPTQRAIQTLCTKVYKNSPLTTVYTSLRVRISLSPSLSISLYLICSLKTLSLSFTLIFLLCLVFMSWCFFLFNCVYFLASDWDREKLLEAWMTNAEECCQRSGIQMPNPPPSGYNAWDTLPSPRTPRTTRSSITSPDQISLMPADEESSLVRVPFDLCLLN